MSGRLRMVALACLLHVGAFSCTQAARPNIVLVVVDTLRADRLGAYGNTRGLTPFIDALAAKGTVFLNAYSASSHTVPAVASLFTSRFPSQHRVNSYDSVIDEAEITMAEPLAEAGYVNAGFSANFLVAKSRGYAQGFVNWWDRHGATEEPFSAWIRRPKVRGATLRQVVGGWLDAARVPSPSSPAFLYVQFMEPHGPYSPPREYRTRLDVDIPTAKITALNEKRNKSLEKLSADDVAMLTSLYDAEVAALDAELRQLFDDLGRRGILANAVVVITADHGEELMDHGEIGHGRSLYNEMVRVPLIVVGPARSPATVRENVSLVDVAPTVLDLVGVPMPPTMEGRSLRALLGRSRPSGWLAWLSRTGGTDPPAETRTILVENERMNSKYDLRRHVAGIIVGSRKLLQGGEGEEIYELGDDPSEKSPRRASQEEQAALRDALRETRERLHVRGSVEAKSRPFDEGTKEKLRALGYDP